jgi:hypothetical protein
MIDDWSSRIDGARVGGGWIGVLEYGKYNGLI